MTTVDDLDRALDRYWKFIAHERIFTTTIRYQWELRPEADKPVLVFFPWWDTIANTYRISAHPVSSSGHTSIPDVLRISPTILGNDIVGVSPMVGPSGDIFKLRQKYDTDKRKEP